MTGQDHELVDLLKRRLELVTRVAAINARMHKLIQEASGIQIELLHLEGALDCDPANRQLARELHDTEDRAASLQSAQDDCLEKAEAVEGEIAAIDRQIAAAQIAATKGRFE